MFSKRVCFRVTRLYNRNTDKSRESRLSSVERAICVVRILCVQYRAARLDWSAWCAPV